MKLNIQMQEKTQPIHETEMSQRENGLPTFKKIFFFLLKLPLSIRAADDFFQSCNIIFQIAA